MKWIAVDYGERRTGLAVCDASELIVTPVTPQIEEKSLPTDDYHHSEYVG